MRPEASPGREALQTLLPVSRETYERLSALVGLVRKWQKAENLVAASTLDAMWTRHVADSAQLVAHSPEPAIGWIWAAVAGFPAW
jgi:16S rRNA (guanine527-N7)-methyltransferase